MLAQKSDEIAEEETVFERKDRFSFKKSISIIKTSDCISLVRLTWVKVLFICFFVHHHVLKPSPYERELWMLCYAPSILVFVCVCFFALESPLCGVIGYLCHVGPD